MRKLKKRDGFTLTEVIISLVILSLIVIGILSYFSTGYVNILRLRAQNIENFDVQRFFEEKMAEAKLKEGKGTERLSFQYQIGDRVRPRIDVSGETLEYDKAEKSIRLFVANQKEVVLETPTDFEVTVNNQKPYYYVGETIPEGKMELDVNRVDNLKIESDSNWLLSYRSVGSDDVVPVGSMLYRVSGERIFPQMLGDFKELNVDSYPTEGFKVTTNMRGKYLTFAGRAVNSYGRVGEYKAADNKLWIMGIPIIDDLGVHTDADLATTDTQEMIATTDQPTANGLETDVRNYRTNRRYVDAANNPSNIPIWSVKESELKQTRQFIALQDDRMWFTNRKLASGETVSILIGNKKQSGSLVSFELGTGAGNTWQPTLRWSLNLFGDGRMTTTVDDPSNLNFTTGFKDVGQKGLDYGQDHSIQIRTSKVASERAIFVEIFIDGQSVHSEKVLYEGAVNGKPVRHSYENARLIFGGNTYINEFAMYTRALRDTEIDTLATYFKGKYDTTYNADQP